MKFGYLRILKGSNGKELSIIIIGLRLTRNDRRDIGVMIIVKLTFYI